MKKYLIYVIISIIPVFVFIACASTTPPPREPKPEPVVEEPKQELDPVPESEKEPEPEKELQAVKISVEKYLVVAGDTLSQIALKFYGTRDRAYYFPIIMVMNPNLVEHPDELEPGMALDVPNFDQFMSNIEYKEKAKPEFEKCIRIYNDENRYGVAKLLDERLKQL